MAKGVPAAGDDAVAAGRTLNPSSPEEKAAVAAPASGHDLNGGKTHSATDQVGNDPIDLRQQGR